MKKENGLLKDMLEISRLSSQCHTLINYLDEKSRNGGLNSSRHGVENTIKKDITQLSKLSKKYETSCETLSNIPRQAVTNVISEMHNRYNGRNSLLELIEFYDSQENHRR